MSLKGHIKIGNYFADIKELSLYSFRCNSLECVKKKACCCQIYDVDISRHEMDQIICYFDVISSYCHDLKTDNYYKNVFEKYGDRFMIDHNSKGYCVFSYFDKEGYLRCGIHSAALEVGINPKFLKPLNCIIWPLSIKEERSYKVIELASSDEWPCVNLKMNKDNSVQEFIMETISFIIKSDI
jgi:hypothetical protein